MLDVLIISFLLVKVSPPPVSRSEGIKEEKRYGSDRGLVGKPEGKW